MESTTTTTTEEQRRILNYEDLSYRANADGYMLLYKGKPIGGASLCGKPTTFDPTYGDLCFRCCRADNE